MKKDELILKKKIRFLLYIITILGIVYFIIAKKDALLKLSLISIPELLGLIVLNLIALLLSSYIFKIFLSFFKLHPNFNFWFGLSIINNMYNYLIPIKGGIAIRGLFLKKLFKLNYINYFALTAGNYLIVIFISAFISLISAFFLYKNEYISFELIIIIISIFVFILLILIIINRVNINSIIGNKNKIKNTFNKFVLGIQLFKKSKRKFFTIFIIQFLFVLIMSIKLYYIYYIIEQDINFMNIIFVQSVVIFSRILSITPGNIGIKEGIIGFSANIMGITPEDAILGAILDRIITMFVIFSLGLLYNYFFFKRIK